jgi:hypothetical protein
MRLSVPFALLLSYVADATATWSNSAHQYMGAQGVNIWRIREKTRDLRSSPQFVVQDEFQLDLKPKTEFDEQWFEQPLDHFFNSTTDTFKQRYWVNTRHYNATRGGPIFVLDGGETTGEERLPFLDTGIMDILAKATGGIGIVLEHRYNFVQKPSYVVLTRNC